MNKKLFWTIVMVMFITLLFSGGVFFSGLHIQKGDTLAGIFVGWFFISAVSGLLTYYAKEL